MVYFDCSTAQRGTTGAECQKSCTTLDMACVSTAQHSPTEVKHLDIQALNRPCLAHILFLSSTLIQISTGCTSGCMCTDGLVSDGAGGCINETSCPCMHNGQVYQPGQTLTVDCNTWLVQCFGYTPV